MKICCHCKSSFDFSLFYKSKSNKDGLDSRCKTCRKQWAMDSYHKNLDSVKIRHKKWMENGGKEKRSNYYRLWQKNKFANDPFWATQRKLRCLIKNSLSKKGVKKLTKTAQILGCDIEFFQLYMSMQFSDGMSFENHGEWHIDHIIPVSSAKNEEELLLLNHYTNLRPLWAIDNLRKGSKTEYTLPH